MTDGYVLTVRKRMKEFKMKIESLDEALRINELTGLPLKVMITEKMMTEDFKMTQEQYDRIAYACENGDLSLFNRLSESDKEYFRNRFEDWESKHCVCCEARKDGAK